MTAAHDHALGPVTERRFADAFADRATITAAVACRLIGVDEKALRALSEAGVVRAVGIGRQRRYTEAALRAWLLEGPAVVDLPIKPKRAPSAGGRKVVPFSGRRVARLGRG